MQAEEKVNVLMVDDHPENLLALEAILDNLGQNLVRANSGEEALRCLLSQDFAVILLDVQMPGMDGFETATLIRQRERSRHTPIIFLTAFSTSDSFVFKGYSLGAVDYLIKPIEPGILTSKVAVFVDLFKKTAEVKRQATQLAAINAELRASEERFRSLSACSPVGIFLTDVQGKCTYMNPRCQAICGGNFLEQNLVASWSQFVYGEDCDRVLEDWSACTREGRECSNEFRLQTPGDNLLWVHLRSSPMLSSRGELMGHVGTVEDITERKQAEEARAQFIREQAARQQAEAANRMKDEFLATLSHELRTPLNSILGWARLLRTRHFDPETVVRALETIERNAKLQAQLIEDILDISRIIRGKLRLNLCPVNLAAVIEAAIETLRPAAEAKAIAIKFEKSGMALPEADLPIEAIGVALPSEVAASSSVTLREARCDTRGISEGELVPHQPSGCEPTSILQPPKYLISGDPDRLQQVVWNLLSNAIKFTPEGGRIEVQLEKLPIEDDQWQIRTEKLSSDNPTSKSAVSYAQIKVIDTGIGIGADFLPHVFEHFRQADSTMTRSYRGLGLGLAIVRHLVELHGGTVHAASDGEGQGATFTVKLPLM